MKDNIFKPLTHLDREGPDANNDRFQRRDNTNFHDDYFQNADTSPINPQEGWEPDTEQEKNIADNETSDDAFEATGCICPTDFDGVDVYEETIVVEFYDDINGKER